MWGTLLYTPGGEEVDRFIPTHVGNTPAPCSHWERCPVHPHACGEHLAVLFFSLLAAGSSPRMWGTQHLDVFIRISVRFIPTHVGNTPPTPTSAIWGAVHPHACGEHMAWMMARSPVGGSSPRMWGTLNAVKVTFLESRFIPTHVGNTLVANRQSYPIAVHPHACGEHR